MRWRDRDETFSRNYGTIQTAEDTCDEAPGPGMRPSNDQGEIASLGIRQMGVHMALVHFAKGKDREP